MSDELRDRIERLESIVEQQQQTIDQQRERIETLEAETVAPQSITRRTVLTAGGLLTGLGVGSLPASADPSGHLGDATDPLTTVYTEQLAGGLTDEQPVDSLLGGGLSTHDTGSGTVLRASLADDSSDGLLAPTDGSVDGIDITEVHTGAVFDSDGNSHLRLSPDGPLDVTQPLDLNGNAVLASGSPAITFDGNANTTIPAGRTLSVDGSFTQSTTVVSSDYTTSGESRLAVETGGGPVTVTLASADAVDGRELTIVDKGGSAEMNPITVETEGSATINSGSVGSMQIALDGGRLRLENVAGNWYTDRNVERDNLAITGGPRWESGGYDHIMSATTGAVFRSFTETSDWLVLVNTDDIAGLDINPLNLSNYESLHVTFTIEYLYNDTPGETTTVRALINGSSLPSTEVSAGNTMKFDLASPLSDPVTPKDTGTFRLRIEGQVTGGTGEYRGSNTVHLWGKIA